MTVLFAICKLGGMTSSLSATPNDTGEAADPGAGSAALTISELRRELGLTQAEFGARIGLANKASVSLLENGHRPKASLNVALAIEALAEGRIDAADLCEDVRRAREGVVLDHAATGNPAGGAAATGQTGVPSGGVAA